MLWLAIWLVLVSATLLGAFLLGSRLHRSGKALAAELAKASEVTARLESLQGELAERYPAPTPPRADLAADRDERAAFREVRRRHRVRIARRRAERLRRAARHWRSIGSPL